VLVLVYDHDTRALADKLSDIRHEYARGQPAPVHSMACVTVSWCPPPASA
jgi:metal-responsive CopG/Arc/MetJ family transcriptional regulator